DRSHEADDLLALGVAIDSKGGRPEDRTVPRRAAHGHYDARRKRVAGLGDPGTGGTRRTRDDEDVQPYPPPGAQPGSGSARADRRDDSSSARNTDRRDAASSHKTGYVTVHVTIRGSWR